MYLRKWCSFLWLWSVAAPPAVASSSIVAPARVSLSFFSLPMLASVWHEGVDHVQCVGAGVAALEVVESGA
jgi:hypothetical protein